MLRLAQRAAAVAREAVPIVSPASHLRARARAVRFAHSWSRSRRRRMLVEVVLVIRRGVCGFVGLPREDGSWCYGAEGAEVPVSRTSASWEETAAGLCDEGKRAKKGSYFGAYAATSTARTTRFSISKLST